MTGAEILLIISNIIIVLVFIALVVLLLTEKLNRAIAALGGATICYFTLTFMRGLPYSIIIDYTFGVAEDNYGNMHSLLMILGMSLIVSICHQAGMFQFIAVRLVLLIANRPRLLMFMMCTITTLISALLNNILTVMIMIPLTVQISRVLNMDPEPYIITEAVLVNIGGVVFSISSIPNILITQTAGISFIEYFINVGPIALILYIFTVGFYYIIYREKTIVPTTNIAILKEFNPWNFVSNRSLLWKSMVTLILVLLGFILIPSSIIPSDMIAIIGALVLILISRIDIGKFLEKVDSAFFLYLMGVFVISGAIQETGLIQKAGELIMVISGGQIYPTFLIVLWASAILSANIDNIPITQVLIPAIRVIGASVGQANTHLMYFGLGLGANLGDNFTPMGDNILVMTLAERNKRPIRTKEFFRIGFISTFLQMIVITIYYSFFMKWQVAVILLVCFVITLGVYVGLKMGIRLHPKLRIKKKSKPTN